jgi:hypothetical protein
VNRGNTVCMTPDSLRQIVSEFLSAARAAVVMEEGAVLFDLTDARYSIGGEHNKCLLHLWSSERNTVRRVLDAEVRRGNLRLLVQRMGQSRPTSLEIYRDRDQRAPSTRKVERAGYENRLRRVLERHFPDWRVVRLLSNMDLEHSFGPAYARGILWRGQSAQAVVGVNEHETSLQLIPRSQSASCGSTPAGTDNRDMRLCRAWLSSCPREPAPSRASASLASEIARNGSSMNSASAKDCCSQ